jgi:putative RecB family exonuclease
MPLIGSTRVGAGSTYQRRRAEQSAAPRVRSWSFSRWNEYETCPLKYKLKAIDKLVEPSSPALERGNRIHDAIEEYVKGKTKTLDVHAQEPARKKIETHRKLYAKEPQKVTINDTWAFRKDWSLTTWNDWDGCWLRVKVDFAHYNTRTGVVNVDDYKSGKFRAQKNDEYLLQLNLYCTTALAIHGGAKRATSSLIYVDNGEIFVPDADYRESELSKLQADWERRVSKMFNDTQFLPRPGSHCQFCHFRKENGGPCTI